MVRFGVIRPKYIKCSWGILKNPIWTIYFQAKKRKFLFIRWCFWQVWQEPTRNNQFLSRNVGKLHYLETSTHRTTSYLVWVGLDLHSLHRPKSSLGIIKFYTKLQTFWGISKTSTFRTVCLKAILHFQLTVFYCLLVSDWKSLIYG